MNRGPLEDKRAPPRLGPPAVWARQASPAQPGLQQGRIPAWGAGRHVAAASSPARHRSRCWSAPCRPPLSESRCADAASTRTRVGGHFTVMLWIEFESRTTPGGAGRLGIHRSLRVARALRTRPEPHARERQARPARYCPAPYSAPASSARVVGACAGSLSATLGAVGWAVGGVFADAHTCEWGLQRNRQAESESAAESARRQQRPPLPGARPHPAPPR